MTKATEQRAFAYRLRVIAYQALDTARQNPYATTAQTAACEQRVLAAEQAVWRCELWLAQCEAWVGLNAPDGPEE